MARKPNLLIVEDDSLARNNLQHILERSGEYLLETAPGGVEALEMIRNKAYDLVLTDLRMEKVDGMRVLSEVKKLHPDSEVIMLTAFASINSAIEAMKRGAYHYIAKPYKIDEVRVQVANALEKTMLKEELRELKRDLRARDGVDFILGKHHSIQELIRTVAHIAPTDCNVLIAGETGTGKELFARALHYTSPRAEKRFAAFNCSTFVEELLVSELFGHERGAFTGAVATRAGLFEAADGGTVFLDEIGDMPLSMQAKLLRVIQERVVIRVGGTEPIPVDVRIVAATNQDLKKLVDLGAFRSDLYFRLNVVPLALPPLREHSSDIPLLAQHFLHKHTRSQGKKIKNISREMMAALQRYAFPGNVRELENLIERAVALSSNENLQLWDLPQELRSPPLLGEENAELYLPSLEEKECEYIRLVLTRTGGKKSRAAEILGIDRVSLWRKINKYGLQ
jgi:DNA-binding NtrC family response regulator